MFIRGVERNYAVSTRPGRKLFYDSEPGTWPNFLAVGPREERGSVRARTPAVPINDARPPADRDARRRSVSRYTYSHTHTNCITYIHTAKINWKFSVLELEIAYALSSFNALFCNNKMPDYEITYLFPKNYKNMLYKRAFSIVRFFSKLFYSAYVRMYVYYSNVCMYIKYVHMYLRIWLLQLHIYYI